MPFGSFEAERRQPRPRRPRPERPAREKPARERPEKEKPERPKAEPPVEEHIFTDPPSKGRDRLNIVLFGRTLSIMQEFLCGMNLNMGEALSGLGLAFYTREAETINDIVGKKKRLEQFCWSFSGEDWLYPEQEDAEQRYVFSISPSGGQDKALDLAIHCVTPESAERAAWAGADAVWLLCDGALLHSSADGFLYDIRNILDELPEEGPAACLIVSQCEQLGRFGGVGGRSELPAAASAEITRLCRESFPAGAAAAILPVQVYGGLECVGMDDLGRPRLHIGLSGFYQTYIPDNCHIPALYTIQSICERSGTDYFADTERGGFVGGIHDIYGVKFGSRGWKPELLSGEGES